MIGVATMSAFNPAQSHWDAITCTAFIETKISNYMNSTVPLQWMWEINVYIFIDWPLRCKYNKINDTTIIKTVRFYYSNNKCE